MGNWVEGMDVGQLSIGFLSTISSRGRDLTVTRTYQCLWLTLSFASPILLAAEYDKDDYKDDDS